jgi:ankyrin repeat protein
MTPMQTRRTFVSWAAANGDLALVQTLLATGKVNPDATDRENGTPLTWAAKYGHLADKVVPDATDWGGRTPLGWAATNGNLVLV